MSDSGQQVNSLILGSNAGAAGGGPGALATALQNAHQGLLTRYEKLKAAGARIDVARKAMDTLAGMADTVTQDDVVNAAGKLVAAGSGAAEMAGMLAEMPPDGESLAGWIRQKDQKLREIENQLDQEIKAARYKMGVGALQHIAGVQIASQFGASRAPAAPQTPGGIVANPLLPSGVTQ